MDEGWGPESGRGGVILPVLVEAPFCTIVIPCYNEEAHVERVLRAALGQVYPADRLEIFVVDGGSLDRTCEIARALASEDRRIVLLHNRRRFQAAAMNLAIERSRGDVIVRMDAHADYDPMYVAASVGVLRRTGALNVGGAMRPRGTTPFQCALAAALRSPLGAGGSPCRDPEREGYVESVWCGAYRREAFELAGLFDPEARTNEDAELNQRILEVGGRIFQSREVVGHYYPRSTARSLFVQYYHYGVGRARTFRKRGRLPSIRPFLPFASLVAFVLLALLAGVVPFVATLLAVLSSFYGLAVVVEAIRVSFRDGLRLAPLVAFLFPLMHFAHGVGFAVGLARSVERRADDPDPPRLAAR